ncbi:hypothetical protein CAC42_1019 [Sphaceloma murrayae]|uniref:tRNA (guanine(9)-N1)-methyltransferase n=1 Tax=Sphaceloma murrayae TaxID=2082308 RepID=A0A2K1R1V0_9PEZI|nr:hypothetical protein CAC42_1019 [Sphaceloma murrayae]
MTSEERPTKLRKLDNDASLSANTEQNSSIPPNPPTTVVANPPTAPSAPDPSGTTPRTNLKDPILSALSVQNPGLSKNQLKKLRRQQQWDAQAPLRREKRKAEVQRKREAKRAARDSLIASGLDPSALHKNSSRPRPTQLPVTFLIDCGFDGLMHDGERNSLGAQITRAYSDNKVARWRCHLAVSGWGGKLRERFEVVLRGHYKGWKGVRFCEEGFPDVVRMAEGWMKEAEGGRVKGPFEKYLGDQMAGGTGNAGADAEAGSNGDVVEGSTTDVGTTQIGQDAKVGDAADASNGTNAKSHRPDAATRLANRAHEDAVAARLRAEGEIVYLTTESPDTLTELKPYSTYIIGGIVDKNREKGICYKRACEAGIKTARLPIGDFLEMQSRKVLATNHVVEIMLKWLEYEDWGKAFLEVIPKRKGGQLKGQKKKGQHDDEDDDDDDDDEDLGASDEDAKDVDPDLIEDEGESGAENDNMDEGKVGGDREP